MAARPWRLASPLCQAASSRPWLHVATRVRRPQHRLLLTLAIETSCDDTCVAVLEKNGTRATLHFNRRLTADHRGRGGILPNIAVASHHANLPPIVREALSSLPPADTGRTATATAAAALVVDGVAPRRPDFIGGTRGPGLLPALATGLNFAYGLATAWQVPVLGVNHMQAHALTPRLVSALLSTPPSEADPAFPFLSLLVSGGHTLLLRSRALCDHRILAQSANIAVGDVLDKCGREILPPDLVASAGDVAFAAALERFAFPADEEAAAVAANHYSPPRTRADEIAPYVSAAHGWSLRPPLAESRAMAFNFSGVYGRVKALVQEREAVAAGGMGEAERRELARETMRLVFEHLGSRVLLALQQEQEDGPAGVDTTLVVAGGVASNRFLQTVLRGMLDARGHGGVRIVVPPGNLCTDNAAMIAWAGAEMFEAGWRTELGAHPLRKWPLDPEEDGGIVGASGWVRAG